VFFKGKVSRNDIADCCANINDIFKLTMNPGGSDGIHKNPHETDNSHLHGVIDMTVGMGGCIISLWVVL